MNPERRRSSTESIFSKTMSRIFHTSAVLGICALVLVLSLSHTVHSGRPQHRMGWMPIGSTCKGTKSECLNGGEVKLDSGIIIRRILVGTIGYRALHKGDKVACSRRSNGTLSSYQICQGHGQANPYRRGCCSITRCRGGPGRFHPLWT
ncbi:hypothetical protein CIPAW_07G021200 [Carya illinoinensis]|uniref:Uncharacterized protein n=1 Tax=Carya illinoinensis TaxID=32201 RepID=A0A8T1PWQ0_CARIL|nr:hypothetical protein CIPAW_07G021200 [Carya illinoinensis]